MCKARMSEIKPAEPSEVERWLALASRDKDNMSAAIYHLIRAIRLLDERTKALDDIKGG